VYVEEDRARHVLGTQDVGEDVAIHCSSTLPFFAVPDDLPVVLYARQFFDCRGSRTSMPTARPTGGGHEHGKEP
jgi:hypothetical protein